MIDQILSAKSIIPAIVLVIVGPLSIIFAPWIYRFLYAAARKIFRDEADFFFPEDKGPRRIRIVGILMIVMAVGVVMLDIYHPYQR
ncbi:hypothetical protein SAMN04488591_2575 [Microbacterium azadirachtae]|uniref:Uncharacterized protein n=1 Tax=Microbacterium azadirachtae TaxID=582680 RepID=A0A1I6I9G8_9MICO|nr:hypothetical protein [Microbacterium azadirachtae]SFR63030.1 hypothetical protein SAMN04488591_2575 [Microbacterium azadirachtae]